MTIDRQTIKGKLQIAALSAAVTALPFSIKVCHGALILYILLWCTEGKWREKFAVLRRSMLLQVLMAFAAVLLVGMLYTENKTEGWLSLDKKIFFFVAPLVLATSEIKFTKAEIRIILYFFVATCFVATLLCLTNSVQSASQYTGSPGAVTYLNLSDFKLLNPKAADRWFFFSYLGLANGIGLHPAYLSMYLVFCILFLLSEISEVKYSNTIVKNVTRGLIVYFSLFVMCLSSRIMILSLMLIYLSMIIVNLSKFASKKNAFGFLFLVLLCLSMLYINPVTKYKNVQEVLRTSFISGEKMHTNTSTQIRVALLWLGYKSLMQINLFTGAGTGDVTDVMKKTSDVYGVTNIHNTNDPHNQYMYVAIAVGITGLLVFIACLALPFLMALSQRDYLLMGFLFLFAALCVSEAVLERQKGVAFFALFFPILAFHRQAFHAYPFTLKISSARS